MDMKRGRRIVGLCVFQEMSSQEASRLRKLFEEWDNIPADPVFLFQQSKLHKEQQLPTLAKKQDAVASYQRQGPRTQSPKKLHFNAARRHR